MVIVNGHCCLFHNCQWYALVQILDSDGVQRCKIGYMKALPDELNLICNRIGVISSIHHRTAKNVITVIGKNNAVTHKAIISARIPNPRTRTRGMARASSSANNHFIAANHVSNEHVHRRLQQYFLSILIPPPEAATFIAFDKGRERNLHDLVKILQLVKRIRLRLFPSFPLPADKFGIVATFLQAAVVCCTLTSRIAGITCTGATLKLPKRAAWLQSMCINTGNRRTFFGSMSSGQCSSMPCLNSQLESLSSMIASPGSFSCSSADVYGQKVLGFMPFMTNFITSLSFRMLGIESAKSTIGSGTVTVLPSCNSTMKFSGSSP